MNEDTNKSSIGDADWESTYFGLILELAEKNSSRYELQALKLLKEKSFETLVNGVPVNYRLTLNGCAFVIGGGESKYREKTWLRIGWGRTAKKKALPNLFARSEADVMIDTRPL